MATVLAPIAVQPSVTYNTETRTINLTVIVTPPAEGSDQLVVVASPCTVPNGAWTMFWDLIGEGVSAHFTSVDISANPLASGRVKITNSILANPVRWTAMIENNVTDINAFTYLINVAPDGSAFVTRHDPTIAVTSDPLG